MHRHAQTEASHMWIGLPKAVASAASLTASAHVEYRSMQCVCKCARMCAVCVFTHPTGSAEEQSTTQTLLSIRTRQRGVAVAGAGNVFCRCAVLHGQHAFVDELACKLQSGTGAC